MGLADATAQPVGASVMAGEAQVLSSGATTVVNQSTSKAIINWQDFSVGQGASVQFNQPNSASVTLNRVTGSGLSTIDGAIRANGQVWLLNPNGVLFGNGARVNVGGLLATTSDIANQDFLEGRYNFSSGGNGEIVNNGQIRAHGGGSVILSAPRVTNRGLISANAGHVVLGGTDTFTVDFNGDHLLSYAIGASTQTGAVTNSGEIKAQGGQILMTARAAAGVQDAVINNTGMAEATSAREVNGEIILDAGEGTATNAGTLDASGKAAGQTGGTVKILGRLAAVADNAAIDVSGDAGGGTALIGGNYQGGGSEMHAQATRIGKGTINADAITSGNGGKVVAWSDVRTDFAGSITARGGASGGDGGQVETSGHDLNVSPSAFVSTLAAAGKSGSWLLDPHNINIITGGGDRPNKLFTDTPQVDANVDPTFIASSLQTGNVILQAATDILFQNNLIVTGGTGNTLTLQAGRSIALGANTLNYAGGNVVMVANDPGGAQTGFRDTNPIAATISSTGGVITAARLDVTLLSNGVDGSLIGSSTQPLLVTGATPTYIKTNNANAYLGTPTGGIYHFVIGNSANTLGADLGTGNLTLVSNGAQQQAPISVNNFTINLPSGLSSGNPVNLANTSNNVVGTVTINAMGRDSAGAPYVTFTNSRQILLGNITTIANKIGDTGPMGAAKITTTNGDINLNGVINVSGLTLVSARDIIQPAGGSINSVPVSNTTQAGSTGMTLAASRNISMAGTNIIQQTVAPTGNGSETTVVTPGILQVNASGFSDIKVGSNIRLLASSMSNGAFTLTTTGTYTLLNSAGGSVVKPNGVQIYGALNASGLITFNAQGDITQNTSGALDVHITSATGLDATSNGGNIVLDDFGHTGQPVDVGNRVSGFVRFSTPGFFTFYNTVKTAVGASPGAAGAAITSTTGGTIQVFDTVGLAAHNDLILNSPITTSNTLSLGATGNIINYQGNAPLSAPNISLFTSFGTIGASDGVSANAFAMALAPRVAGNTLGFMAQASNGNVNLAISGSGQIGFGSGINPGLRGGNVLVNLNGTGALLTQIAGTAGQIQANNVNFGIVNSTTGSIILNNTANAIGAANLFANIISLTNNGALLLLGAKNSGGSGNGAASVNVQTSGTLTLGDSNTAPPVIATGQVFLRSTGGAILASPRTGVTSDIVAGTVGLAADGGTIGLSTAPVVIAASNLAARTINGDINIGAAVLNSLPLNITSVVGPGITLNGINAGTGNVALLGGAQLIINAGTIVGNNLKLSGAGVTVTNAQVSSLTANVGTGGLALTSPGAILISDPAGLLGITSAGPLSLTATAGNITQASGAAGLITAPTASFSAGGTGNGITLSSANNAIGAVTMSAGINAFLYNTGNLTINAVNSNTGSTSGVNGLVNIQTTGILTLATAAAGAIISTTTLATSGVVLHAGGAILQGSGVPISASFVTLVSDSGTLGTALVPLSASTINLSGRTTNKDIFLSASSFNGSTVLGLASTVTTGFGLIANITQQGINAGTGNALVSAGALAVSATNTSFPIVANNLRVTAASINITNATVSSFSAGSSGSITFSNSTGFQLNNISGGSGSLSTTGAVTLSAQGTISQATGQAGQIGVGGAFTATATASGTPGILFTNGLNAISGTVSLSAPGTIAFVNTVNTVIGRASGGSQGGLSAQLVDIEVLGAGNTLTLSNTGNVINGNTITLHANSSIVQGNTRGSIAGINLGLISDTGSIGSFTGPIALRGIGNLAARAPGDIYLNSVALAVNGVTPITQITIGSVANLGPNGGTINGISSGGGDVGLAFGLLDVLGFDTIKANNLFISGNTIQLDNILVSSLAARTGGGDIDITSGGSFQINNSGVTTNPGITSTGAVYLTSGGAITQASGTAGGITAGSLSVFGVTGVTLDNALNAVTGNIQLGSLGDALLVNSLASHLNIGLAGGTFTLVSGGDLELVAGPSIATLSSGESLTINDTNVLSALSLAQIGGIVISFRVDGDGIVLSTPGKFINNFGATALLAPGSRFLVYSADPANDVFGGLKTTGAGIFNVSYPTAITAAGNRYIFSVASSTNTDFMTASIGTAGDTGNAGKAGLTATTNTAAAPDLIGFVAGHERPARHQPPPPPPARADVLQTAPPPPPPQRQPPPRRGALADLAGPDSANAEPPSASDQATSYVVGSLDGGTPLVVGGSGGGILIPRYLTAQPNPPTGTLADATQLPAFGNTSLWQ